MRIVDLTAQFSLEGFVSDPHSCTHIEAPAYLLEGGKRFDEFGLEAFVADAVLLDLTGKRPGQPIDDEDFEAAEESAGIGLREGEIAILWTGSSVSDAGLKDHVYLSVNATEYLEFKRPIMVATDAPSLDQHGSAELPAHVTLARAGILILEGLCNLEDIQESRFRVIALPLRLNDSTSPVRAIAVLEEAP
jgi:kynurenine formamidase